MMLLHTKNRSTVTADVCIVGAGILGLAHAFEARRRGLSVVLLERDHRALGTSVQNFGHAFFAGVADGEDLECAMRSRERWLELGTKAGLHVVPAGTLVVARDADELEVLEGVAANERRGASIVSAERAGTIAPIPTHELVGAMHTRYDVRVDPREAVVGLAALLESDPEVDLRWGETVHEVEPGAVHGSTLTVKAPLIVLCPGPQYRAALASTGVELDRITLCKLQMISVAAPGGRRYDPALVTGLSMIRYPAFTAQPASARILARLTEERPELVAAGLHLLITQRPTGELVIGDTHAYGDAPSPFRDERLDEVLLAEVRRLLGVDELTVVERWLGLYPAEDPAWTTHAHFHITEPFTGARTVEVVSGLGMTLAFGRTAQLFDELLAGRVSSAAA